MVKWAEPGAQPEIMANAGTISDTLCTLTDGAFAGQVPPYSPGTWALTATRSARNRRAGR